MRLKVWRILLLLACFFSAFLVMDSLLKIDLDFEAEYQFATDQRSNFVISHDFGWVKESLVTLHRDHWIEKKKNQQLYRNNSLLLSFLVLILIWTTINSFVDNQPGNTKPKPRSLFKHG